jgi:hypothetical protein
MPFNLMLVSDACFAAGDRSRSDGMLQEALALGEATGEIWIRPELHRRRACYALAGTTGPEGYEECAEQWLADALHEARKQGDRIAELRASYDLARLWIERGERREARDLLAPICGWLAGRGDLPETTEARAMLDTLP